MEDPILIVSEAAKAQLHKVLIKPEALKTFRVSVLGGGCSGFQYNFSIVEAAKPNDHIVSFGEVKVAVDELALGFIKGSTLDFETAMVGSQFVIHNPNAAASCGCGSSFSI